jgi:hypothetical protein
MSKEDFLNSIKRFEESEAKYEALAKKYEKQMPDALTNLVFEHLPKLQSEKEKFEQIISSIAQKYTDEIWEDFNTADWMNRSKDKVKPFKVPKPKTKEDEEQELKVELKNIPKEHHALYSKIFWETDQGYKKHNSFVFACHNKMKEVFTSIYFDNVLSLEADYLRYFDGLLYFQAGHFVQEIYEDCDTSIHDSKD